MRAWVRLVGDASGYFLLLLLLLLLLLGSGLRDASAKCASARARRAPLSADGRDGLVTDDLAIYDNPVLRTQGSAWGARALRGVGR